MVNSGIVRKIAWSLWIAILLASAGCSNSGDSIPFPREDNRFVLSAGKKFSFSEPEPLQWESSSPDSVKSWPVKKFDVKKLKAKHFDILAPKALLKPMDVQKFDWNAVPDTIFNKDSLPVEKLEFKTSILGTPRKLRAGLPGIKPGTSRGVMDFGVNAGLPGVGRCFAQDQNGLLWIGTDKGLVRYDGEHLEIYGLAQGLEDENILSILAAHDGKIWIGTRTGVVEVIDRQAGLIGIMKDGFEKGQVFEITQDSTGQVWIVRNGIGILIANEAERTLKKFSKREGLNDDFMVRVKQDSKGLIWIGSGDGANIIDWKAGKNKKLKKANGLSGGSVYTIMEDRDNRIWLAGYGTGAQILDIKKGTISLLGKDQGLPHFNFIATYLQDRKGVIWMGTDSGHIVSYDEKAGLFQYYNLNSGSTGNNNIVFNLKEDSNGLIWVGTFAIGTYYINRKNGSPGNYTTADGLSQNAVWSILQSKSGLIWMGTIKGIDIYDPVSETLRHIGKEQGLLVDRSVSIMEDRYGKIWAGGNESGISVIDPEKGTIQWITHEQGLFTDDNASMHEDKDGQIWLGSGTGILSIIDPVTKQVRKLSSLPEFYTTRLNTIRTDQSGQIWLGSIGGGVAVIDPSRKTIKKLNAARGLSNNDVTCFLEDSHGNMWIGTEKGIQVMDVKNNTLYNLTVQEGLSANGTYTLNERNGRIYAGTANGFTVFRPTDASKENNNSWDISYIGKEQGLTALDVAENSSLITSNGQLWVGIDEHILSIIDDVETDSVVPNAIITGINILDKPQDFNDRKMIAGRLEKVDTLWQKSRDTFYLNKQLPADTGYLVRNKITWETVSGPYNMPANLQLPYDQNYLSFSFTGAHLSDPGQTKYRYVLEGIDKNWSAVSEKPFSENYRDLPPGKYTFRVSSVGMNGRWCTPAEWSFSILPPWWKTWWAYMLYALLSLGIVGFYIQYRSKALKKDNLILEEKVISRTNELRKSLNELRDTQYQLVQSEKMASLGELTAGIAHEIQNPLNFVNNFSEISIELVEELGTEIRKSEMSAEKKAAMQSILDDLVQNQQKINLHGKRADSIVKGMLQHSRSSSGVKEPTDINALADEYFRLSYHGLRAKDNSFNAAMKTEMDPAIGQVNVVPQDIGRVLLNLYNNAFYAVLEKGKSSENHYSPTVTVSTKKREGWVDISVKDNGSGIPESVKEKIFQPFFTTKPTGHGTGLGLSLSYDIVKAHNGELSVESKEGEGATFTLSLPAR